MNTKITIAVPTNRYIKPKTVQSLLGVVAYSKQFDYQIIVATEGFTTAENRIYCVSKALENKSDYLFFCDDDMSFEPDTLERLINHRKEVIGVNTQSRKLPLHTTVGFLPEMYDLLGEPKDPEMPKDLFEAKFVGTAIMLIDMKVFEKLGHPYFDVKTFDFGMIKVGEDAYFCEKCREKGIKIWCDPTIPNGHWGEYNYSVFN